MNDAIIKAITAVNGRIEIGFFDQNGVFVTRVSSENFEDDFIASAEFDETGKAETLFTTTVDPIGALVLANYLSTHALMQLDKELKTEIVERTSHA
jgi:hypothetical protein